MAMVHVDGSSLQANTQPQSLGLVCGSAAAAGNGQFPLDNPPRTFPRHC